MVCKNLLYILLAPIRLFWDLADNMTSLKPCLPGECRIYFQFDNVICTIGARVSDKDIFRMTFYIGGCPVEGHQAEQKKNDYLHWKQHRHN